VNTERPLDGITSIKVKLAVLVGTSVLGALLVAALGDVAGIAGWVSAPVTLAVALGLTWWLARGMTSPLREMTDAARRMAAGDYAQRVTATSSDEVGELARAFNAMAGDLAGADLERRRLVATVSHELRTPLTAQRALLENLVDGVVGPDDAALEGALAQAERLSDLVGDLLDLSRIDAGAAPLDVVDVHVADLLAGAADEAALDGRPVAVRRTVTPPELTVRADPARLAQLVANLLDNAVRHSPPGGEVRLDATTAGPDRWALEVRDDGPGIAADRAERVFERFGSGGDAGGGTGLGLAIARWVAELHGGGVEVVPTPAGARGACLRTTLPTHPTTDRPTHLREPAMTTSPATPGAHPAPPPGYPVPAAPLPAAAPYGPQPPSGPSLLDRFWPERGIGPQVGVVLAALGIGAFAATTWPFRAIGLETTLTMLLTGALMWVVARNRRHPWTLAMAGLAVALACVATLRASDGVITLSVLAGVTVAAVGLTRARGLLAMVASCAAWPLSALRGLPLLGRTLAATSRRQLLWPVLRTAAITLVALVVFGGLFATADELFGDWVTALVPDLGWDTIILRGFVLVLVAGVALTGAYLALNPPALEDVRVPQGSRTRRAWEWAVPVGVVVALFALFLLAQASEMWGGLSYLRRTGTSYADSVHEGFGQLTTATFLTIVVVALTMRVASRETVRDRTLLRVLLGGLGVFTLAVVASALYRMSLYQDAYGYTVLRVLVDGLELWFGLVVAMLLLALVRLSASWVPRAVLVSGAVFTLGFAAMNPDAWVASRNIDRYEATGRLDTVYLSGLSGDAAPVIAERLPAEMASCVLRPPYSGPEDGADRSDDLVSWNLGRVRAADARAGLPEVADCTAYLDDDYRG
jgi:two-component system sensor histidine kinase BaeS